MIVILMGPAGAGKSTVGRALADELGWPFLEADDLHSRENIEKIRAGTALTDLDRSPWIEQVHSAVVRLTEERGHAVVACSALRRAYRERIADGLRDVHWVYLAASPALLATRLARRTDHFAGPEILASQLAALEPPADAVVVPADQLVQDAVAMIRKSLRPQVQRNGDQP